jgi:DNA-binding Lrp family transcriptional regulator
LRRVILVIEDVDGRILHSLQLAPRASFRRIAEVVDTSEQTVARRYHRMRRDGLVRVIGVIDPRVYGECQWVVRIRAEPDDLPTLADALVRRPDVTHANVLSGWTELVCVIRAPLGDAADGLLQRLPRTSKVLGLDIDLILHTYGGPAGTHWTAYGHTLDAQQAAALLDGEPPALPHRPPAPGADDLPLFDALADDGRAPHARLAEQTGWSAARVTRRVAALEASGTLVYDVDVLPDRLGFDVNAMLWLTVPPRHLAEAAGRVAAHEEIASVASVSGRHNLMAIAICRDVDHLYRYLSERLSTVEQLSGYDVSIRAKRLKQAASLVAHGRLVASGRSR